MEAGCCKCRTPPFPQRLGGMLGLDKGRDSLGEQVRSALLLDGTGLQGKLVGSG